MSTAEKMYVLKRNGIKEEVRFDKITSRIEKLCYNLNMDYIDPASITFSVIGNLYSGITTRNLDNLAAEAAAKMATRHPDYAVLAARIAITDLHKETKELFSDVINDLHNTVDPFTKRNMIDETYHEIIKKFKEQFNSAIVHDRDFIYDYFSYKTLEQNFLMKINGKVVERPQHMFMRVAVAIHKNDYNKAIETYSYMSQCYFTHASSILVSACSLRQQMSSCFILTMVDDSIEGIYDTLEKCAIITKAAGNIGLNVHNIRAKGTRISGINGIAQGLIPMLKVYNDTACYIDQGKHKRPGEFAIYLEPWHADIFDYLNLKKETGKEELRAKQLVYALWIPDLFMKRVFDNEEWSLMCPHECPGLHNVYGEEFENLYTKYEKEKRFKRKIIARDLWTAILIIQTEIGSPYMLYKDHCNRKSNQQNLGTIKGGNLTTDVVQYSSQNEVAICNTATLSLDKFIDNNRTFNFLKLKEIVKVITKDLNKIMEIDWYPLEKTEVSNLKHKPIGIGVQGLADTFILMRYPFESEAAQKLNTQIFETLYYGALEASCELAQEKGKYSTYEGSPTSSGILQYDMWNVTPTDLWDWSELKIKIAKYGIHNSLLIALTPTTSTAGILGNSESVEPYTSYINTKRGDCKTFEIVNPYLLKDLTDRDLWDEEMKNEIISNGGSIQNIVRIPHDLKKLYKTVWEMPQKTILKMAVDRAPFIDQSQALNVHIPEPTYAKLTSMHFYGWKKGLKTGMYNLKTRLPPNELQLVINKMQLNKTASMSKNHGDINHMHNYEESDNDMLVCSRENVDESMMCGA